MDVIVVVSVIVNDVAVIRYGSFTPTHYCFGSCLTAASRTFLFCRNCAIHCTILLCCQCCQNLVHLPCDCFTHNDCQFMSYRITLDIEKFSVMILSEWFASFSFANVEMTQSFDLIPCSAYLGRYVYLFMNELLYVSGLPYPNKKSDSRFEFVYLLVNHQITRFCYVAGLFHLVLFAFYPGVYMQH